MSYSKYKYNKDMRPLNLSKYPKIKDLNRTKHK